MINTGRGTGRVPAWLFPHRLGPLPRGKQCMINVSFFKGDAAQFTKVMEKYFEPIKGFLESKDWVQLHETLTAQ